MYTYPNKINNNFYGNDRQFGPMMGRPPMGAMPEQQRSLGFFGPFLLGGLTGGLVAPYFYGRPNNNYYPPYYYSPYYR